MNQTVKPISTFFELKWEAFIWGAPGIDAIIALMAGPVTENIR